MKNDSINIILTGMGGQGVLVAGDIVARAFVNGGYDVKASTLRGIAQRGGAVFSHVRAGRKIYSPLIPKGEADVLMAFDLMGCLGAMEYLKKKGPMLFVDREASQGVIKNKLASKSYAMMKSLQKESGVKVVRVSYEHAVKCLKNAKTLNVFMLGILSQSLLLRRKAWLKAITEVFSQDMRSANLSAFLTGAELKR